jgi:hypothetical protein
VKPYRASEAECRKAILEAARFAGWRIHCPRTAQTGKGVHLTADDGDAGWPDVTLSRGGQLVIVELKRKPNKVEPEQQVWLDQLAKVPGVSAFVVWVPEEMDTFIKALQRR